MHYFGIANIKNMEIKIKKLHKDAVVPTFATDGSAGLDLTAVSFKQETDESGKLVLVYHTGLAIQIPKGYVGLLCMRSSVAKKSVALVNAVGILDSDYTGEVLLKFKITTDALPTIYQPGEKCAQLVIIPYLRTDIKITEELDETTRGDGGFGSTDTTGVMETTTLETK